jgi:hypothetical protein
MDLNTLKEKAEHALDFLRVRKRNYELTFGRSYHAQAVLSDLAKFCRADKTCFDPDPRIHAVLEGRREVWLRITQHLHLSPEQMFALYNGQNFNIQLTGEDDA